MSTLREVLERHVRDGSVPGAVGLVARRGRVDLQAVGGADTGGGTPMAPDSIFRIASHTGRYGWVGGTGTAAHIVPATGTVAIMLTQVEMAGPRPPRTMRDFWRHVAGE